MKKTFKLLVGLVIVYIMIYSCNKRLSSKYETNIRYYLEKEKQEKLLKEREIPAIDPFKDTISLNSDIDSNINNIEKDSKQESWKDFFKKSATTNRTYESDELTDFQPGVTTSASQLQKASQAPEGQFNKCLNDK
ncbi:hypothetical protein [uncultured Flavobacterium sp.]|uniref:hypothetical protein n=1 Tax=uncultured Flavobacterium sp. TaxID=165435 RepID=UPI002599B9B6|nr:hypothetical protein [uncultured Flavobacterium sp.]